jgi:signal transduction histidine kinase
MHDMKSEVQRSQTGKVASDVQADASGPQARVPVHAGRLDTRAERPGAEDRQMLHGGTEMQSAKPTTVAECGAYIAHEVNQPLTAILINAETALEWLMNETPNVEAARRAVGHVIGNCHRAGYVVSSIRNLTRKSSPGTDDVDLARTVEDLLDMIGPSLARHGVRCDFESGRGLPTIKGDRGQLERVISNLIANAVEAMAQVEGRRRVLQVRVRLDRTSNLQVAIGDTGAGIDPVNVDRVFEPWFTTKSDGLGLGLSICRAIVEAHDGRLSVSSNRPCGSIFAFTVPTPKRACRTRSPAVDRIPANVLGACA